MSNTNIVLAVVSALLLVSGILLTGGPVWAAIAFGALTYWLALPVLAAEEGEPRDPWGERRGRKDSADDE